MSKTKKPVRKDEVVGREREAPAHKSRREVQQKIGRFLGAVEDDSLLWEDEEILVFERIKRKSK